MSKPVVILAAGGTGGHMFPAQSVAESFAAHGFNIILTTDDRGLRYADNFAADVKRVVLPTGSFSQGSIFKRIMTPFRLMQGVLTARKLFQKHNPVAVIGFGGYPAAPSLFVARMSGVPYFIHEQNAVLGRVNKRFQSGARKVACGLWPVVGAGDNAIYLGNPVRGNVLPLAQSALPTGDKIRLVVFGGSQGASVFSTIMPQALAKLPNDLRAKIELTQQAREGEIADLTKAYADMNVQAELAPFFKDMPNRIANSHFVVARSGASTLAELQVIGRGSILVPLPSAMNDHQRLNAKAMVAANAALEYDEQTHTSDDLAKWLEDTLTQPKNLARMGDAAHRLARPNAAQDLCEMIMKELNNAP